MVLMRNEQQHGFTHYGNPPDHFNQGTARKPKYIACFISPLQRNKTNTPGLETSAQRQEPLGDSRRHMQSFFV